MNFPWLSPTAKLNSQVFWEPYYIAVAWTHITGNMSRARYSLLCDVTAHALYSNGPCANTIKKHFHHAVA
jgi:hypothetical protein